MLYIGRPTANVRPQMIYIDQTNSTFVEIRDYCVRMASNEEERARSRCESPALQTLPSIHTLASGLSVNDMQSSDEYQNWLLQAQSEYLMPWLYSQNLCLDPINYLLQTSLRLNHMDTTPTPVGNQEYVYCYDCCTTFHRVQDWKRHARYAKSCFMAGILIF